MDNKTKKQIVKNIASSVAEDYKSNTLSNSFFHFEEDKHIKGFKEALIKKGISKEFIESKMNIIKI